MKKETLDELKKLDREAAPAPWHNCESRGCPWDVEDADDMQVAQAQQRTSVRNNLKQTDRTTNTKLLIAARSALPRLLAEREKLLEACKEIAGDPDGIIQLGRVEMARAARDAVHFAEDDLHG